MTTGEDRGETIGKDISKRVIVILRDGCMEGKPRVSCFMLLEKVLDGRARTPEFVHRYMSVIRGMLQSATIKMHRDEETGLPKEFELLKKHN